MRTIVVNGQRCTIAPLGERDVEAGALIGELNGRRVYRVLCLDDGDVIARNVRHEGIIEAIGRRELLADFGLVQPL